MLTAPTQYADGCTRVGPGWRLSARYYTKAAAQGHAGAQNNLGYMKLVGEHFEKDLDCAFDWYAKKRVKLKPSAGASLDFVSLPHVRATPIGRTWKQANGSSLESGGRSTAIYGLLPGARQVRGGGGAGAHPGHESARADVHAGAGHTQERTHGAGHRSARQPTCCYFAARVSPRTAQVLGLPREDRGCANVAHLPTVVDCGTRDGHVSSRSAHGASVGPCACGLSSCCLLKCKIRTATEACVLRAACCVLCWQAYHWMGRHALALHDKEQGRPPTNVDQLLLDLVGDHL